MTSITPEGVFTVCRTCDRDRIPVPVAEFLIELDVVGRARHCFVCPFCEEVRWHDWDRSKDATGAVDTLRGIVPGLRVREVTSVILTVEDCLADVERTYAVAEHRATRGGVRWDSVDFAIWREIQAAEDLAAARRASA